MYIILIVPIISIIFAQGIKFAIKSNKQKFKAKNLFAYSGMPSGHSALVVSLMAIIGIENGLDSPLFAISFILAIIVIRDALGIRQYLGEHGKVLNALLKDLEDDDVLEKRYPHLLEKIGHTPAQVAVGSLIGLCVSLIAGFIF